MLTLARKKYGVPMINAAKKYEVVILLRLNCFAIFHSENIQSNSAGIARICWLTNGIVSTNGISKTDGKIP